MAKCQNKNCSQEATHSPTINIPAQGVPIDLHRPVVMYLQTEMCHDHAKAFGKAFKWDDARGLKSALIASLANFGRDDADFDRSFPSTVKLTDPNYIKHMNALNKPI